LQDAPPSTLELWERYLVYGIAFGIAERVLQGAQLHMPDEMHQASSIYWISPTGDLGSGPSALGSAISPPASAALWHRLRAARGGSVAASPAAAVAAEEEAVAVAPGS